MSKIVLTCCHLQINRLSIQNWRKDSEVSLADRLENEIIPQLFFDDELPRTWKTKDKNVRLIREYLYFWFKSCRLTHPQNLQEKVNNWFLTIQTTCKMLLVVWPLFLFIFADTWRSVNEGKNSAIQFRITRLTLALTLLNISGIKGESD